MPMLLVLRIGGMLTLLERSPRGRRGELSGKETKNWIVTTNGATANLPNLSQRGVETASILRWPEPKGAAFWRQKVSSAKPGSSSHGERNYTRALQVRVMGILINVISNWSAWSVSLPGQLLPATGMNNNNRERNISPFRPTRASKSNAIA